MVGFKNSQNTPYWKGPIRIVESIESQNVPSWKRSIRIIDSNSWLHIEPPKNQTTLPRNGGKKNRSLFVGIYKSYSPIFVLVLHIPIPALCLSPFFGTNNPKGHWRGWVANPKFIAFGAAPVSLPFALGRQRGTCGDKRGTYSCAKGF